MAIASQSVQLALQLDGAVKSTKQCGQAKPIPLVRI